MEKKNIHWHLPHYGSTQVLRQMPVEQVVVQRLLQRFARRRNIPRTRDGKTARHSTVHTFLPAFREIIYQKNPEKPMKKIIEGLQYIWGIIQSNLSNQSNQSFNQSRIEKDVNESKKVISLTRPEKRRPPRGEAQDNDPLCDWPPRQRPMYRIQSKIVESKQENQIYGKMRKKSQRL